MLQCKASVCQQIIDNASYYFFQSGNVLINFEILSRWVVHGDCSDVIPRQSTLTYHLYHKVHNLWFTENKLVHGFTQILCELFL